MVNKEPTSLWTEVDLIKPKDKRIPAKDSYEEDVLRIRLTMLRGPFPHLR